MADRVLMTETLRDAWQGLKHVVPTEAKREHLARLIDAGFTSIDIGSFVSTSRVPAMADTDVLLDGLALPDTLLVTALIANGRGLDRLLDVAGIGEVLYPFSLSEAFQKRNTNRTREAALSELGELTARCHGESRRMYATISMAFGNDEGEPFDAAELAGWVGRLRAAGVDRIGLADTTAQATPAIVRDVLAAVRESDDGPVPGVHLHVTEDSALGLVDAALDGGCRSFDVALGGLGGCPFSRGPESNLSTLQLAQHLVARGFDPGLPLEPLPELDQAARRLAG